MVAVGRKLEGQVVAAVVASNCSTVGRVCDLAVEEVHSYEGLAGVCDAVPVVIV